MVVVCLCGDGRDFQGMEKNAGPYMLSEVNIREKQHQKRVRTKISAKRVSSEGCDVAVTVFG